MMLSFRVNAVYMCTEGPRFETEAEIKTNEAMGSGHVVGMTSVPEVVYCLGNWGYVLCFGRARC